MIIDPAGDPSPGVPSVGSANWSGGLMATRPCSSSGTRAVPLSRGRKAEEAARMVLRLRDGLELTHTRLDLATSLVVCDSTAAPAR